MRLAVRAGVMGFVAGELDAFTTSRGGGGPACTLAQDLTGFVAASFFSTGVARGFVPNDTTGGGAVTLLAGGGESGVTGGGGGAAGVGVVAAALPAVRGAH
jgi:hypothetical protein